MENNNVEDGELFKFFREKSDGVGYTFNQLYKVCTGYTDTFALSREVSALVRLRDSLHEIADEQVRFHLDFGTDALRIPYADLEIETQLPLLCQRSLRRFLLPIQLRQRLAAVNKSSPRHPV